MKKTFPFLFTLIGLSILGILFIQITWLQGLFLLQKNQLLEKVNQAGVIVSADLGKKLNGGLAFHFPKKSLSLSGGGHSHSFEEATLSDMYNAQDLDKRLRAAMVKFGLIDLSFEFALQDKNGNIEIKSKQFEDVFVDELDMVQTRVSIIPQEILETTGPFETLIIIVPNVNSYLFKTLQWVVFGAALFIIIVLAAFIITIRSLIIQKKLSEIKSDFINNMTHELKTPIATINLALDSIKNPKIINDQEKVLRYIKMIREENKRMHGQVENVLRISRLEKNQIEINTEASDMHDVIDDAISHVSLLAIDKQGSISTHFQAIQSETLVNQFHMTNVLVNILENALKYSDEKPKIDVYTESTNKNLLIKIEDQGIGMAKNVQKQIFDKFYREQKGNIHNTKGHGLGLAYVKEIVDTHHGTVFVDSEKGKGSTFTIKLPLI